MENHPIDNLMKTTMEHIKEMVDVNTIVGDPIQSKDGSIIIPISKVSFGFASGGSEFNSTECKTEKSKFPFGGGAGAGVTIRPIAFIVIRNESIKLLPVEYDNPLDKLIDSIPQLIETLKNLSNKNKHKTTTFHENGDPIVK
ncbi:GerW family sporulation protein [Clostridium sp. SYSU_GA19001]|uniref:GerW family sporulation protein n=1 Tax=Clostridium caldaquaticum TaxID=2940653 RepID=UPI0020777A86|nr:GerW family sporulation protein [Clostridium caldaquaticum]MCM8711065.1 GerW family sporulation protein [Clostridium caldaquaticum]